jgi:iron complex outermembrane recepter protein
MRTRLLLGSAGPAILGLMLAADPSQAALQQATLPQIELPAMDLSEALRQLAVSIGHSIIAPDELVRGRRAPAIRGQYRAEEALALLLHGSGLTYRPVDGTFVITRAEPEGGIPATVGSRDASEAEPETIVVTGTHVRAGSRTSPVIAITRRQIDEAAPASVEELMRRLPQNVSAGVAQENFAVTGAGADITEHGAGINLRGLGQRATLVLVNGRRLAPSGSGSFVDVSLIPISAIERVEILTDGASAIYGSDAVAGVVNFILREDFRGLETMVQAGTATRGGGDQLLASVTAGGGWREGRAMLAYEYRSEDQIKAEERDFTINLPPEWSLFPKERRHSLFGTARQNFSDSLSLELAGTYSARDTDRSHFIAGPAIPVDVHAEAKSLGGTAALQLDVGRSWMVEASASYFRSRNRQSQFQPGGTGLVNSFNSLNSLSEFGIKVDGNLLELLAGPAKLALGAQTRREYYSSVFETQVNPPNPQSGSRDVRSLYGEISLPLFSARNRRPGLERLVLTAAARLEHYDQLGSNFDPKIGALWSPLEGLALRGSYGTSFRAPLLSEALGYYNIFLFPAALLYRNPAEAPPGVGAALIGSDPDVGPEASRNFSAGFDWSPPQVPRLNVRATYYSIRFSNRIALPTEQIVVVGDPALEPIVTRNPAIDSVTALFGGAGQVLDFSGPGFTNGGAGPEDVVVIVDARVSNTAETKTDGIDFGLDYAFELGANRFRIDLNANRIFRFDDRLTSASPVIHTLNTPFHPVDLRARGSLSWARGALSAIMFVNHTDGYKDDWGAVARKVGSFTTVDLGIAYAGPNGGPDLPRKLRLALNVQNLFDADPPRLLPEPGFTRGIGYDPVNATGRGRTISVQLRKSW